MSHYFVKQLKIGLGWIIVLAIISAGIYFIINLRSIPTCFDNKQNQGEENVDCGGPCKTCNPIKSISIISQFFIPTLENTYDLAAKIKNPNANQGASVINYEFSIYDSEDQLIGTRIGKTYILSQETKYIVEPKFYSEEQVAKIALKFNNISWEKTEQINDLELRIKNTEYQIIEDGSNMLTGVLENKSSYNLDTIEIYGVLFDADNNIIAVGKTTMNTVIKDENRGFEIFWPYPIPLEVKSFDVRAYTNVFLIK